jgi:selenophosphate synthetase-related protein
VSELGAIVDALDNSAAVQDKIGLRSLLAPALAAEGAAIAMGDDCAAIEDGEGYLLFAAEGLLHSFVAEDPWFAGYCAVMVNISDVCAMGGRPLAVVDVIWSPDRTQTEPVWAGMLAASAAYGVPIVGGHTTIAPGSNGVNLSASILGRARKLMTSFAAEPGDDLFGE